MIMNSNKSRYWIAVSDASKLKIFSSNTPLYKPCTDLTFVQEIDHDKSRLKSHDLGDDKPGRYKTHESGGSAYQHSTDIKDVEKINFAREIALLLKQAKNSDKYEQLIIIVHEKFHGVLKAHLDKTVLDSIYKEINRDYVNHPTKDLIKIIFEEINGTQ